MQPRVGFILAIGFLLVPANASAAEPVALTISGVSGRDGVSKAAAEFSLADLASLPRTKAQVKSRDGKQRTFEGTPLAEILKRAGQPMAEQLSGPAQLTRYILVTAHDGYRVVFSIPEIDPAFSDNRAFVADTVDGQPLSGQEGPLRIIVPNEKREARWMRNVERVEILSAPEPVR